VDRDQFQPPSLAPPDRAGEVAPPLRRAPLYVPPPPAPRAAVVEPVQATPDPLPEHVPERSGSGYETIPGAGLPVLPGIQWERNARGGWEAWHLPPGQDHRHRRGRVYLGYLGVKALPTATPESIAQWVETKRAGKGIETNA